jgi:hypothetical protein
MKITCSNPKCTEPGEQFLVYEVVFVGSTPYPRRPKDETDSDKLARDLDQQIIWCMCGELAVVQKDEIT